MRPCALCALLPRSTRVRRARGAAPSGTRGSLQGPRRSSGAMQLRRGARPFSTELQRIPGGRRWPTPSASYHLLACRLQHGESCSSYLGGNGGEGSEDKLFQRRSTLYFRKLIVAVRLHHGARQSEACGITASASLHPGLGEYHHCSGDWHQYHSHLRCSPFADRRCKPGKARWAPARCDADGESIYNRVPVNVPAIHPRLCHHSTLCSIKQLWRANHRHRGPPAKRCVRGQVCSGFGLGSWQWC